MTAIAKIVVRPITRVVKVTGVGATKTVRVSNMGARGPVASRAVEVTAGVDGPLELNRRFFRYAPTTQVTFRPADAVASLLTASVSASTWPLKDGAGASVGSVAFAAGQTVGTVTLTKTVWVKGEILEGYTPSSVNPSTNTMTLTLPGDRP